MTAVSLQRDVASLLTGFARLQNDGADLLKRCVRLQGSFVNLLNSHGGGS